MLKHPMVEQTARRQVCLGLAAGCAGSLLGPWARAAEPAKLELVYARFSAGDDPRIHFPLALLKLAMQKMGRDFSVRPSEPVMERTRAIRELARGGSEINIIWTSMAAEVERELRPIRIPLYRGLIGHRIFIIHKQRLADFAQVKSLDDLKRFTAGQGIGWVDQQIMQNAGLKVVADTYDSLFKMVDRGLVDYFPRGANEAVAEVRARAASFPDLVVEPRLMLVYKSDNIFYTSIANEALASLIEQGLLAAYADGSFLKLYNEHPYVQKILGEARLDKRLRLDIANPMLSSEDNAIAARFWL